MNHNLRSQTNRLFRIRVKSTNGKVMLRGAGRLYIDIGELKAIELCTKAVRSRLHSPNFKLYNSFEITFVPR